MTREGMKDIHVDLSSRHNRIVDLAIECGYASTKTEFIRRLIEDFEKSERLLRSSEENHEIEQE